MPEARRFLRYVIPGLLAVLEALVFAALAWPAEAPQRILDATKDLEAGGALMAFLVTGVLGYAFSAVHHTVSWLPGIRCFYAGDYRPFFRRALDAKLVTTDPAVSNRKSKTELSVEEASQAMAALWNESRECSPQVKAANDRVDSLTDLMHSAGAASVGSVVAFVCFVGVACEFSGGVNWWRPTIAFAVLFLLHVRNYFKLREHATRVVEVVFWQELKRRQTPPTILLWPESGDGAPR
jgi:hypothetical protein